MAEFAQKVGKGYFFGALVDDEAHCPVFIMQAHINDRTREAFVGHGRHRYQQLAVQIGAARGFATTFCGVVIHVLILSRRVRSVKALSALPWVTRRGHGWTTQADNS